MPLYALLSLLSAAAAVAAALAFTLWRRAMPGARALAASMACVALWSLAYAGLLASTTLQAKLLWVHGVHLWIVAVPPLWLAFGLAYTGQARQYRGLLWGLAALQGLFLLLELSNPYHGQYWSGMHLLNLQDRTVLQLERGPAFYVQMAVSYGQVLAGLGVMLRMFLRELDVYRRQLAAILSGVAVPFAANILHNSPYAPVAHLDFTPFAFLATGLILFWGLYRYRLLDLVPVACDVIVESMIEGVLVLDGQDRLVFCNSAARRLLPEALSPSGGVTGLPIHEVLPQVGEALGRVRGEGRTEIALDARHFALHHSPFYKKGGKPSGWLVVLYDITRRRRIEDNLRESERKHRHVVNSVSDILFAVDIRGNYTFANRAALNITGYSLSEAIGMNMSKLVAHEADLDMLQAELRRGVRGEEVSGRYEYAIRTKSGELRHLEVNTNPQKNSRGRVTGFFGVARDITLRKRTEDELYRMRLRAEEAQREAEAANRAKSAFLANMSHEIRTPLNAILGYAQIMRRNKGLPADLGKAVDTIEDSGRHLLGLINDVLDISKIEAGGEELRPVEFDLQRLLLDLSSMFEMRCRDKGLDWRLATGTGAGAVRGDEGKLRQVLINLLGNAVKFTDEGHIRLHCRREGNRVYFAVEDSGVGIAYTLQADIFDPFRQGDGPGRESGSGLGLAIARRHVDMMGGELQLESAAGRGAVFSFALDLPAADAPLPLRDRWEKVERLSDGQSLDVLIVDDVETNRDVLVRLLEQVGAGTRTAASGREALEAARDRRPDIVFMDISMPGMDGRQTFQALSEEHGGGLPAVAVTASVFEHQRQEYLGLGFRAVLDKPVRAARLYACLAEELGVGFEFAAGEVQDETPEQDLLPAELPADLLDELHQAASGHNITRLRPALDRLKALGPAYDDLAAKLEAATRRYDMEAITRLLDKKAAAE